MLAIVFAISLFFSLQQKKVFSDETIFFVVDISNSMNTKDIIAENASGKISRLDVAKLFIEKTMESEPNAYYGLVVFAQSAVTLVPATMDV
ncbi:VWA domain-containing protein [Patescibacteria group bacterium]|nr:VWA domain-containing protein [Patescibacteria group bacterium]